MNQAGMNKKYLCLTLDKKALVVIPGLIKYFKNNIMCERVKVRIRVHKRRLEAISLLNFWFCGVTRMSWVAPLYIRGIFPKRCNKRSKNAPMRNMANRCFKTATKNRPQIGSGKEILSSPV